MPKRQPPSSFGQVLQEAVNYDLVRAFLGLVLLAAAALKGHELASEALPATPGTPRPLLVLLVLFELACGLWLWFDLYPRTTRWATLALFVLLMGVSFAQVRAGQPTCGCFGTFRVNPWAAAVFDFLAVLALVNFTPPTTPAQPAAARWRLAGCGGLFVLLAGPAALSMASPRAEGIMPHLRGDERLGKDVQLDLKDPTTGEVLRALQKGSGVDLTTDAALAEGSPDFGRIRSTFKAWAVMEFVAQKQPDGARWEKAGDGYRLRGAAPLGSRSTPWLLSAAAFGVLCGGFAAAALRRSPDAARAFGRSVLPSKRTASVLLWRGTALACLCLVGGAALWLGSLLGRPPGVPR